MSDSPPEVDALVQLSFAVMDALTRAAAEHELSATQVRLLGILRDRSPTLACHRPRRTSMTGSRPRLLLIEDDAKLGPVMRDVLDEVYDVTLETTGEAGFRSATGHEFDVMIVDRRLPGGDGTTVVES